MRLIKFLPVVLAAAALTLTGCPDDDEGTTPAEPGPAAGGGPGGGDGPASGALPDTCTVPYSHLKVDLEAMADNGAFAVKVVDADHIPARKFENAWTVQIVDPAGEPLEAATLMDVVPFMPAHGHGADPVEITEMGGGMFQVDKIDLWMDGGWTITFEVEVDGERSEAVFEVCVPK